MPRQSKPTVNDPGPFARLLVNGRRAAGLNAAECAHLCGLSQSFLSYMERGQRAPELNRVPDIAAAYRIQPDVAAWTWVTQFAPNAVPHLVTVGALEDTPVLQRYYSDSYQAQVRAKMAAADAKKAARRADRQAQAVQMARGQAVLDTPLPVIPPFETPAGHAMIDSRGPQEERLGDSLGGPADPVHSNRKSQPRSPKRE